MFTKINMMILMVTLLSSTIGVHTSLAQSISQGDKNRAKVTKYGVGKKVTVLLKFDEKFKGKITNIEQDTFTVRDSKSNTLKTFSYEEVLKVKKKSYAKWITIGVIAGAAAVALFALNKRCSNEGNNNLCL